MPGLAFAVVPKPAAPARRAPISQLRQGQRQALLGEKMSSCFGPVASEVVIETCQFDRFGIVASKSLRQRRKWRHPGQRSDCELDHPVTCSAIRKKTQTPVRPEGAPRGNARLFANDAFTPMIRNCLAINLQLNHAILQSQFRRNIEAAKPSNCKAFQLFRSLKP